MGKNNSSWLSKLAFWTIVAVTLLYATSIILSACGIVSWVVSALQSVATGLLILIAALLGWNHVKFKSVAWKILYIICLVVVIAGVVVPYVL